MRALLRQPLLRRAYIALALVLWALPHAVRACSCMAPPAPAVAVERADAVFEARVESVRALPGGRDGVSVVRYELEVLRVWKGEVSSSAELGTRASGSACERNLAVGKVYVIYAGRDDDGELTDNRCSRTRLASTADEDLAVLGPGDAPRTRPPTTEPSNREPPRIAPPAPDLGPSPIAGRGCVIDTEVRAPLADAGTGLLALVGLAWARRRRSPP